MMKRYGTLCIVWMLVFVLQRAACQRCLICAQEKEGGRCQPNQLMDVPENITIADSMCTAIEGTEYHKNVLCKNFPDGYNFECVDSSNSQFSCRSTCGPSVDSIGTGPEFDLLNQGGGGLLLGKGANKKGLLDFSNFKNGVGFNFGLGNIGGDPFGQNPATNNGVKSTTNIGSGASAGSSTASKEDSRKTSSNLGDKNLFNNNLFGSIGFNNDPFPNKQPQSGNNPNTIDSNPSKDTAGKNVGLPDPNQNGQGPQENPLERDQPRIGNRLHKERDTDGVPIPVIGPTKAAKPGSPAKTKLVKIPNLDLKVSPSNLVVEPEKTETRIPVEKSKETPKQFVPSDVKPKEQYTNRPSINDPYSRYPKKNPREPLPQPPPRRPLPPPSPQDPRPEYIPSKQDTYTPPYDDPRENTNLPRRPPPQQNLNKGNELPPSSNPSGRNNLKPSYIPSNIPPPNQPSPPEFNPRTNQYPPPKEDQPPRQPPNDFAPYPNPTSSLPDPSSIPRNYPPPNSQKPRVDDNLYQNNPNKFDNPRGGSRGNNPYDDYNNPKSENQNPPRNNYPDNRQQNNQGRNPVDKDAYRDNYKNNNQYGDGYDKRPPYPGSNDDGAQGVKRVQSPEGLDGSRLRGDERLGKNVDFAGTSLLADSDYLDKSGSDRYNSKVPEEFEKPFKAENDIFPGFSNFANGDQSAFGTGKSVFNLFDGKNSDPPGFRNGEFNFNNKNFLKPSSYKDNNNNNGGKSAPNAPTGNPGYDRGQSPPPPKNSFDRSSAPPSNQNSNRFQPPYQQPQSKPRGPLPTQYPEGDRNDLIRQNERRNPSHFDQQSFPTSGNPFLTNRQPGGNRNQPYQNPKQNNYNPNPYNLPNQRPTPSSYPSPNSQQNGHPPKRNDRNPQQDFNIGSPLNLFGNSQPFNSNPDSRPQSPGPQDYRGGQPSNPPHSDLPPNGYQPPASHDQNLGRDPYQTYPSRNPTSPSSNEYPNQRFQAPGNYPPPNTNHPQHNRQQQNPPTQPQQGKGQFGFQSPSNSFTPPDFQGPSSFPSLFGNNDNNDNSNNNNNNFAPPEYRPPPQNNFAPNQPNSNQFPIGGNNHDQTVPNVHINNFLNNQRQPPQNQHNPQGGATQNPYAAPTPNRAPDSFQPFYPNQPATFDKGNDQTPYSVPSSQPSTPNFVLNVKPLDQQPNSRPDSFFTPYQQNQPKTFETAPTGQPSAYPPYETPPNGRSQNPLSFGDRGPSPSFEPSPYPNNGQGNPLSFGNRHPSPPYEQSPHSPNDGSNNFFGGRGASPPYNQPQHPSAGGQGPPAPYDHSPSPRPNSLPPAYISPGDATPGKSYNPGYVPNQENAPNGPFHREAPRDSQSRPPNTDSGFTPDALLDSSPFTFEDPTGSFGGDKRPPPQSGLRPDYAPVNYGVDHTDSRPSYIPVEQAGVPVVYHAPESAEPHYVVVDTPSQYHAPPPQPPQQENNLFIKKNPGDFGFDRSFHPFGDKTSSSSSPFKDGFRSDRFSDPSGYFGDDAFTDDTTQEETNQTSDTRDSRDV